MRTMRTLGSAVVSLALLLAPGLLWLYTLASCLLASTMWWLCFTSSGSLTCWLLLHLLLHTSYWPLALAYGAFMAWDWTTCQRGGRRWDGWAVTTFRGWRGWKLWANIFPVKIVACSPLPPSSNYLLCSHPHGVVCTGAGTAFATEGCGWGQLFPGLEAHFLTLQIMFWIPGFREFFLSSGCCAASKGSINELFKREGGVAAVLVPGGAREAVEQHYSGGSIRLVLNNRKGFIRIALQHGILLVPTFTFGEQGVYDLLTSPPKLFRNLQDWFLSTLGLPLLLFCGRGGLVRPTPLTVVVGHPIHVKQVDCPSTEEVDLLHQQYIGALTSLYSQYNPLYGDTRIKLTIL